jgi:hypothetical protein
MIKPHLLMNPNADMTLINPNASSALIKLVLNMMTNGDLLRTNR